MLSNTTVNSLGVCLYQNIPYENKCNLHLAPVCFKKTSSPDWVKPVSMKHGWPKRSCFERTRFSSRSNAANNLEHTQSRSNQEAAVRAREIWVILSCTASWYRDTASASPCAMGDAALRCACANGCAFCVYVDGSPQIATTDLSLSLQYLLIFRELLLQKVKRKKKEKGGARLNKRSAPSPSS